MKKGIAGFFEHLWKYIWPFLITLGATGLCYLFMTFVKFDNLREFVDSFMNGPSKFLFGNDSSGILIRSFWGFDIGKWFEGLFENKELLKLLCLPLIFIIYVGGFFIGGLVQLLLIILGGIFIVIWFIISFLIGTVFELIIVILPGLCFIAYLIFEIFQIKNQGQEEPIGENLVFVIFALLQLCLSIIYYVMFANVF